MPSLGKAKRTKKRRKKGKEKRGRKNENKNQNQTDELCGRTSEVCAAGVLKGTEQTTIFVCNSKAQKDRSR
jgi:hypothetical protein